MRSLIVKRWSYCIFLGSLLSASVVLAQASPPAGEFPDTDHDGLNDALEQKLLLQFQPTFMIGRHDCSVLPAEFKPDSIAPEVKAENGTVYGQVFPAKSLNAGSPAVELHYYHLWRKDCGSHAHPLDTEHVAVLIQPSGSDIDSAQWKAIYWYAAAHENTVCDVSQIAQASAVHAEDHGATVWISPGKHASYLDRALCQKGCGADHCVRMTEFVPARVINLGEPGFPMNGSVFISSPAWPLASKMSTSDFPAAAIARINEVPDAGAVSFRPGRHPVQGIIATSSSTEQALATSRSNTTAAIKLAGDSTGDALSKAGDSTTSALSHASGGTGNALQKTYEHTRHALATSIRRVGQALRLTSKPSP